MDALSLVFAEVFVSFVSPFLLTRNPKVSLMIASIDAVLMLALASVLGWY